MPRGPKGEKRPADVIGGAGIMAGQDHLPSGAHNATSESCGTIASLALAAARAGLQYCELCTRLGASFPPGRFFVSPGR
jgi:hypothetical protein